MLLNLILSIIHLCHCGDIIYNHTNKENNLYFVFTTFRHGARRPLSKIDFFGNHNYKAGDLTEYGKIQHLEIGRKYRKRYSNFMNIDFDKNEIYIRSSKIRRAVISTEKELEGFFNKTIDKSNIFIVNGTYSKNLYFLDKKDQIEMKQYLESCQKRKLSKKYKDIYKNEIFPNIKQCHLMKNISDSGIYRFCDSIISHYFQYVYNNESNNIISKCSYENIKKFYDFCVKYYDSFRGFSEYGAFVFYKLFQHIFKFMNNAIEGKSKLKMIMIGGHDITVGQFMNFLDGLQIIHRTHYPHYACNIVIELRKYNYEYYLEFYYNDILKYNKTLKKFKSILDNSIYSNLYNYCGMPSPKSSSNKTINIQNTIKYDENSENNKLNYNISIIESFSLNSANEIKIIRKYEIKQLIQGKNLLKKLLIFLSHCFTILCSLIVIVILIKLSLFLYLKKKNKRNRYINFKENRDKILNILQVY